jgi:hypothetical protein
MFNDKSEMDGTCSTIRCSYGRIKPKATWYNTTNGNWVCFTCAQEANRNAMQMRLKYGGTPDRQVPPPCITAQEHTFKLLSSNLTQ